MTGFSANLDSSDVRPFPDVGASRQQISNSGGHSPLWSHNGEELFYLEPDTPMQLISVAVETEPSFSFGNRRAIIDWPYYLARESGLFRTYDVDLDDQRFLAIKRIAADTDTQGSVPQINVVLNWFEELKERVPVP